MTQSQWAVDTVVYHHLCHFWWPFLVLYSHRLSLIIIHQKFLVFLKLPRGIFRSSSCHVDGWMLVQKQLRRCRGGCWISLVRAGLFDLVRMMNESAEGEAGGQRHPVSPAMSAVLAWFCRCCVRDQQGAERAELAPVQCYTWGAALWVFGCLLPLSDCSRLNSALLQCQRSFPLE